MTERFDIIVIGVGAMGAATCDELARRGSKVLGLEQFSIPHNLGSSHGESRVIRLCYYEHPDYVRLLQRAYELWHQLERDSGESLLHLTGGLYMGNEDSEFIQGTLRSAREHDLPHEFMSREEVMNRYPQFDLPTGQVGVWEPQAGIVRPEASISAMRRALQHGACIHGHETVLDVSALESKVIVRTERASYEAEQVVICAGAWASQLLGDLAVKLEVARHVLSWIWPRSPELFTPDRFPIWGLDDPDGYFHYGFPLQPGRVGLKAARHHRGDPIALEDVDRTPCLEDEKEVRVALARYLPEGDGPVLAMSTCLYTNSPDAHFIIDRHPKWDRILLATGFSGHGFKFAPVVGQILADLARDGASSLPVDFLGLSRFEK